jgi:hypothetical protein
MNKQKLSLAAIQDKLSRNEMKQIMAGSMTCYATCSNGQTWGLLCNTSCYTYGSGVVCGGSYYDYGCR